MINYSEQAIEKIQQTILNLLASRESGFAPISDVIEAIRYTARYRVPSRIDEQFKLIERAGFTVMMASRKTHEEATLSTHGSYYYQVSL